MSNLQTADPTIYEAMQNEINRQTNNIVIAKIKLKNKLRYPKVEIK